jgi:hypothetical protein
MNHEPPYLHLYAQKYQHADAEIIGNREALVMLRESLNKALSLDYVGGKRSKIEVFTNDGEGYSLFVRCVESDTVDRQFDGYRLPYTQGEQG